VKVATVSTPYAGSDLVDLRSANRATRLIIVHPSYAPQKLERQGSDSSLGAFRDQLRQSAVLIATTCSTL